MFYFVYTRDLHLTSLDPNNGFIDSGILKSPINVIGSNFIPVGHLIQC